MSINKIRPWVPPVVVIICLLALSLKFPSLSSQAQRQTQPSEPPQQGEVVRISSELVQTDVTVVDKQGRLVDGLSREQFELLVDGTKQPIAFFESVTAGSSRESALLGKRRAGSGNVAEASAAATAERGRTTFFFVDDLHLAPDSMKRTRDLLLHFVDDVMGPKDQVLIATASGQLGFLQQLTGEKAVLRTVVQRLTFRMHNSAEKIGSPPINEYEAVAIERNDPDVLSYLIDMTCEEFKRMGKPCGGPDFGFKNNAVLDEGYTRPSGGSSGATSGSSGGGTTGGPRASRAPGGGANTVRLEAERSLRARARVVARQVAQVALNTLLSLESLLREAATIPERKLVIFISDGFFLDFVNSTNAYDVRRVADAALRSGTVIYSVDARGLVSGAPDAGVKGGFDTQGRTTRIRIAAASATQEPLNALAADTGGRFWRNSNDMGPGIAQALRDTSSYYLLAWRPEPGNSKDRFRRIEVRIKDQPDFSVRVRRGFFEEDVASIATGKPKTIEEQLFSVIRSSYPRNAVPLKLSVGYMHTTTAGVSVPASILVNGADSDVDVMGAVANDKGDVISSLQQHLTVTEKDKGRLVYTLQFPNIVPGLYQVRVAVLDAKSGRTGSAHQWIEVPDTAKGDFAMGTVFLSEVTDNAQKPSISPDRRFVRSARMRFQAQIYNATRAPSAPDLTLELQLSSNGQTLVETPPSAVSTEGVTDLARIPLTGEFPLQGFEPGRYAMRITIRDRNSKKIVSRDIEFTVE